MKKLTNYIFAALLLLITAGGQAQVTEVCAGDGTDSVTLSLAQYQYGNIQWQYSEDTLTWTDIRGAHDTVFRCLPERECYYRARIEYPNCPLDTTQVTHILFTPTANAGPDRILNEGYVTTLFGNKVEDENTRCMWQVIEGDSPDLEDPTYRNSRFTGPDTLYKLTWTVANACGVSIDTVEIRYVHTVMYDAIAIVDTTDIILSDSAERASGIYRIVFSNPAPNITDSTILMGMDGDDFLRKVIDFEWFGDTCEIYASPADILDILVEGAINLEVPLNFNSTGQRNENRHIYTRAQLMNDPRFQSGQWNSLFQEVINDNQVVRARESRYLFANPVTISGNILIRNLSVSFSDDAKYDADIYSDPNDNTVRAFAYLMGDLHTDFILELSQGSGSVSYDIPTPAGVSIINPFVPNSKLFEVGLFVPIEFTGTVQAQEMMEIPIRVTKPVGMMGTYHGSRLKLWKIFRDMDVHYSSEKAVVEKTELDFSSNSFSCQLSLSVGAKLAMSILELGLNFSVLPTLSYAVCYGTDGFRTEKVQSEVLLKLSGEIWDPNDAFGAGAGLDLWNHSCDQMTWYSPYRISANTNRNLVQPSANSYIQDPIYVHVYNQDERPVRSGRKVLFEATGGVVSATPSGNGSASAFATTNASGVAQIYWKPLSSNASLKASVLDCEGYHVKGSPLYFYSNGVADLCLNSTLSLAIGNNGRFITSGGSSPFLYSSDGVSWLPEINMSYPLAAGTYFVKDANGCIASATYTVQEATPACNLTTSTYQNGLQVRLVANNGTAPYHFYVDGLDYTTSGTTQRVFQHTFAQDGEHTLTVTDANGCTQSTVVRLLEGITPPTVVTLLRQNNPGGVYDLVFGAVTDNGGSAITNRGVEWSLSSDLSNATAVVNNFTGDGLGRFSCQVMGVTSGTTFYVRAYAINSDGYIGYGRIITLTMPGSTPGPGSTTSCGVSSVRANETGSGGTITAVRDHQNNSYAVVQIGNQCWLKENMRCTTSPSTGANMVENPAVETNMSSTERRAYYYDNNPANAANGYGLLYNWPAAMDGSTTAGSRGICPEGWHLPTDAEWTTMLNAAVAEHQPGVTPNPAFGSQDAGSEGTNTSVWQMLNDSTSATQTETMNLLAQYYQAGELTQDQYNNMRNAILGELSGSMTNSTGFTAVPAGTLYNDGFGFRGVYVLYWSSSSFDNLSARSRGWTLVGTGVMRGHSNKDLPFSVRCLRDANNSDAPNPPSPSNTTSCGVSSIRSNETGSNDTITAVRDHENNSYAVVQIGNQCWLKENMRCTTSPTTGANMVENPAVEANMSSTERRAYYYDNNPANAANGYGLLYNWPAAMDGSTTAGARGICPEGWHLPTDAEWTTMERTVSGSDWQLSYETVDYGRRGNHAGLLAGGDNWSSGTTLNAPGDYSNTDRNISNFWALPAGYRGEGDDVFYGDGDDAHFWSSSQNASNSAYFRELFYDSDNVGHFHFYKSYGFSVRCLRDDGVISAAVLPTVLTSAVENVAATTAICGGNVVSDGGANVTARGVCWSSNQNPTISDSHTADGSGEGSFTSNISGLTAGVTYYVRAYATNSVGTVYGNEVNFTTIEDAIDGHPCLNTPTVTDIDDNTYNTVQIGQQCWMKENLRTTKYADGTSVPLGNASSASDNYGETGPYRYAPNNDEGNVTVYGYLYNWPAVMNGVVSSDAYPLGVQGICPTGWHVPSVNEWNVLMDYVGSNYACNNDASSIAKALAATTGWWYNADECAMGNNSSANNVTGFSALPVCGYNVNNCLTSYVNYWTSTQHNVYMSNKIWFHYQSTSIGPAQDYKGTPCSVRCLRDSCPSCVDTTVLPIDTVVTPIDTSTTYGSPCPNNPTVTDHQGNVYNTVQIGNQCWLKENMRCTTSPSTGANIVENPANGTSSTERRAYYFHNDPANFANGYGLLYNWPAAMDGSTEEGARGICPEGWHLPTDAEWNALVNYVSSQRGCICSGNNSYIAKALASETDWNTSTIDCAVGKTLSTNNASGFSALPAGYYYSGGYSVSGNITIFWTSTQYNSIGAYISNLNYNTASVYINPNAMSNGYSVRCLRNDGGASAAVLPTVSTSAVENVTATSATCGGNVTSDGGANVTARGICWSTSQNPTISDSHTTDGSGVGSFTSNISGLTAGNTYYVRAYATNSVGTAYGNEVFVTVPGSTPGSGNNTSCSVSSVHANETGFNGTITAVRDHENNSYSVVQIGGQCWLKENMRCTTSPTTGASIVENPAASSNWSYYERRAYYINNNPDSADNGCGLLYNWRAAMDGSTFEGDQGICPEGWHVPRHDDWTQLTDYVSSVVACRCDDDDVNIAKALASSSGWNISTNECAIGNNQSTNDISGFSALPVGVWGSNFAYSGNDARFWSSSPIDYNQDNSRAVTFDLSYDRSYCFHSDWPKFWGLSVRCVRDSSNGDEPSPSSTTSCNVNTIYNNETGNNGTITAVQDHENNSYAVVQIGGQCWMKENMRCTTSPSTGANMVASGLSNIERRVYYYNNNPANAVNGYGLFYNWPAAMDGDTIEGARGICPEGWHVPTDTDWTKLGDYVRENYACIGLYNAKALASVTSWNSSVGECYPGDQTTYENNASGFGALPVGFATYYHSGGTGYNTSFWSSAKNEDDTNNAYARGLEYNNPVMYSINASKSFGYSVRCLRDSCPSCVDTTFAPVDTTVVPIDTTVMPIDTTVIPLDTNTTYGIPCPESPTVTDHQGNVYNTVQIGSRCWMKENMRCTTSPTTGANIVQNPAIGASYTERRAYYYNNDPTNAANGYGLLYNWPAAMDGGTVEGARGICPVGWHIPTDVEWTALMSTTVNIYQPGVTPLPAFGTGGSNGVNQEGVNTDIALALTGLDQIQGIIDTLELYYQNGLITASEYNESLDFLDSILNSPAGDFTGFSAFCAGAYTCYDGDQVGNFSERISTVAFWSSSQNDNFQAWWRVWGWDQGVYRMKGDKGYGVAVRCIRDNGPSGSDTTVAPVDTNTTYGIPCQDSPTVTDHQGNVYNTVQIGNQCWLKENMRCTTSPSTGANMVENPAVEANMSATVRRAYYYDNNPANAANGYGLLYNWPAAMDGSTTAGARGICPEGWHLPTDAEWTTLMNTAVSIYQPGVTPSPAFGSQDGDFEGSNTDISQMLLDFSDNSLQYFYSSLGVSTYAEMIQYVEQMYQQGQVDQAEYNMIMQYFNSPRRNVTGFSAVPAGVYNGIFEFRGQYVGYCSSSAYDSSNAWYRVLLYLNAGVGRVYDGKEFAASVRCVRN